MNLIPFGHLVKPHGLNGFISCRLFNEKSRILEKNIKIYFNNSDINNFLTIESINYDAKNYLIKFFEIFGRDKIENYRNCIFYVNKNDLPKLSNEENYFIDFIGCTLFDQNKKEIGLVKDIIPIKNNDILIFDNAEGEKMISFAKDLILFFDKDKKKLIMDIFEGSI
jgi:16S rRNA processing protein RimM